MKFDELVKDGCFLDLSLSEISDDDMSSLFYFLTTNRKIKKVDLSHTDISDEGLYWLNQAEISELNLGGTWIDSNGLIDLVKENKWLTKLTVNGIDIDLEAAKALAKSKTLRHIVIVNSDDLASGSKTVLKVKSVITKPSSGSVSTLRRLALFQIKHSAGQLAFLNRQVKHIDEFCTLVGEPAYKLELK